MKKYSLLLFIFFFTLAKAQEQPKIINVQNLDINTKLADFGVTFYKNNLVLYASSKIDETRKRRDRGHNRMGYLEFYIGEIGKNGQLTTLGRFSKEEINVFYESDITFAPNGTTIYFTLNNYIDADYREKLNQQKIKTKFLSIFKATVNEAGAVSNIEPVPFNSSNYSVRNPKLSPNGNTLYFASDMEGGFGKYDLYKVAINGDGTYGKPVNLGKEINTKNNEFFPFLSTNNIFYFSSDGHGGGGFLDIFSSNYKNGTYTTPQNVDNVNSEYDDIAFVIDPIKEVGYFSSSRKGKGNMDIYAFTIKKASCNQTIVGIIKDKKTKKIVENATVMLYVNDALQNTITTSTNGTFSFKTQCKTAYTVVAEKENYTNNSKHLTTSEVNKDEENITLYINPIPCYQTIEGIVLNNENAPIANANLTLLDNKEQVLEKIVSKTDGTFSFNTQVNCKTKHQIVTNATNYSSKTKFITTTKVLNAVNNLTIKLNESKEFIVKRNIKMIKTNPIYFDLNSSNIREDAAIELDKVIAIMKKYPTLKIKLNSHTDSRAPDSYNLRLSKERAASSVTYIIARGINPSRITGEGFGETQLVNKCSNGVRCTETEHEENRRIEIIVLN